MGQTRLQLSENFSINKLNPKFCNSDIKQIVFEHIKQLSNLEFEKVVNTKSWSAIRFVPKWIVKFNTQADSLRMEILGTSGKTIVDETLSCHSESHSNFAGYSEDKRRAICEICGKIFCRFHIFRNEEQYVCEQLKSSISSTSIES